MLHHLAPLHPPPHPICDAQHMRGWPDFCKTSIKNAQLRLQQLEYYLCENYLCFEEMLMTVLCAVNTSVSLAAPITWFYHISGDGGLASLLLCCSLIFMHTPTAPFACLCEHFMLEWCVFQGAVCVFLRQHS